MKSITSYLLFIWFAFYSFAAVAQGKFYIEGRIIMSGRDSRFLGVTAIKLKNEEKLFEIKIKDSNLFKIGNLKKGQYTISIDKFGYNKVDTTVSIFDSSIQNFEILLREKRFSIVGKVIVISGIGKEILDNISLRVYNEFQTFWGRTDKNGLFEVSHLKKGKYKIKVGRDGYAKVDTSITISGNDSTKQTLNITIRERCEVNQYLALKDIQAGTIKLLIFGGIAPSVNTKFDVKFEKKYNLKYHDFGCIHVGYECVRDYNQTIFTYLDKKYGKKWRVGIRKDVISLKNH